MINELDQKVWWLKSDLYLPRKISEMLLYILEGK